MILVKNLKKIYKQKNREIIAVSNLCFNAEGDKILCFIGPNGSGKTTTVKMLCGLINPTEGEIYFDSISIEDRRKYLSEISVVLEGARNVFWRLTPKENMDYFARMKGFHGSELKERINYYLEVMDLNRNRDIQCRFLSRGNIQKVAIACALVPKTKVLILDEPTLGLDIEMAHKVMRTIQQEKNNKRIVIITTHDMELVEGIADKVAIFKNGKVTFINELNSMIVKYAGKDKRLSTAYLNYLKETLGEYSNSHIN